MAAVRHRRRHGGVVPFAVDYYIRCCSTAVATSTAQISTRTACSNEALGADAKLPGNKKKTIRRQDGTKSVGSGSCGGCVRTEGVCTVLHTPPLISSFDQKNNTLHVIMVYPVNTAQRIEPWCTVPGTVPGGDRAHYYDDVTADPRWQTQEKHKYNKKLTGKASSSNFPP